MKNKNTFRFLRNLTISLVVLLSVLLPGLAYAAGNAVVSVTAPAGAIEPGEQFTISINAQPNNAIAGMQFNLSYNPNIVTAVSVAEGNLLNQGGASTFFNMGQINNTAGTITGVFGAITNPGQTVATPGTFAVITMTAGSVGGSCQLTLSNVIVGDIRGHSVTVSVINDTVNIAGNRPPVLNAIGNKTVVEGELLSFTVSATDPDGDSLTYSVSNLPSGAAFDPATQTFNWTPDSGQVGSYPNVHFEVTDSTLTDFENISITVNTASSDSPMGGGGGSGGGGGGGGGGATTSLRNSLTADGLMVEDLTATDIYMKVELRLRKGTIVLNKAGQALTAIRIAPIEDGQPADEGSVMVGQSYDIEPNGATFDASANLVFRYSISDIPPGIPAGNLYIAFWDPVAMTWTDLGGTVDAEAHMVSVEINHLSSYTLMAHTRPASLKVMSLDLTPNEIAPGGTVTASIVVNNTGDFNGIYPIELKLDGVSLQTRSINLAGGTSETVTFTVTSDIIGEHQISIGGMPGTFLVRIPITPAAFIASELKINPTSVNSGENINISLLISNSGDLSGSYQAVLEIDGVAAQSKEITLDGGASETISFDVNPDTTGLHNINIGGLQGAFEVTLPTPLAVAEKPKLELSSFSATPTYDTNTNTLVDVRILYQMNQTYEDSPGIKLMMRVLHNGELAEQVPLLALSQLQEDGKTGKLSYIPSTGWAAGEYAFRAELHDGENVLQTISSENLTVTPEALTSVFSWWTLGAVIGITSILIVVLIAFILYFRRDMLRPKKKIP